MKMSPEPRLSVAIQTGTVTRRATSIRTAKTNATERHHTREQSGSVYPLVLGAVRFHELSVATALHTSCAAAA